jgi:hypothetical protein
VYLCLVVAGNVRRPEAISIAVGRVRFAYPVTTGLAGLGLVLMQVWGLVVFQDELSYSNANDIEFIESAGLGYKAWYQSFKIAPAFLTVLYATIRYGLWRGQAARILLYTVFACEMLVFLRISNDIGNRLDVVCVFNAFLFVELIRRNSAPRGGAVLFYLKAAAAAGLCIAYMIHLAMTRTANPLEGRGAVQLLLAQDYFPPAHILFAAVANQLSDIGEVVRSNVMNSLILMNYPYLQQFVTDVFNPGVATRNTGYAFYILAEGFLAFGNLGFVYNGIVIGFWLWVWRRIATTESPVMNAMILPLLAMDLTNLCRGQSAYFIKYLYIHFLPGLFMVLVVTGYYLRGVRIRRETPLPDQPAHSLIER